MGLAMLAVVAILADVVIRRGLVRLVHLFADKNKVAWSEPLIRRRIFTRVSHVIPAFVVVAGIRLVPDIPFGVRTWVEHIGLSYVILMVVLALTSTLSAANEIYDSYPVSRNRPLKGLVQVLQLVIYLIGIVLIIATLVDRSPLLLLSGFGAMTAVVLLVFKDTILGFVASVQLTANDMVRVGDWIEMPAYGADGDVIEVALHTVKVRNFDKTITTIPTYKLFSESFRNWRGMEESGGRRIKRAVRIDQTSIRFLEDSDVARLRAFALLRPHFERKSSELAADVAALGNDGEQIVNRRRLTNIGVFRAYIREYLRSSPHLNHDMTTLVRQLPSKSDGLPIEVYCFTKTTDWAEYEGRQSDIFDHIIAITPEFGLRIFQEPTGFDFSNFARQAQPSV